MYHIFFPRSCVNGHLDSFHVLAIVNHAAMNIKVHVSFWITVLSWYMPGDPLEKEMATHFSILTWETPWTEEPRGLQSIGSHQVRHNWVTNTHTHTHPGVGLLDHTAPLFLVFWGPSILFSIVAAPTYILTNNVGGFPFLHIPSSIYYL